MISLLLRVASFNVRRYLNSIVKKIQEPHFCPIGRLFEMPISPAAFPTDFMVKAANQ